MTYRENYALIDWSKPLPDAPKKQRHVAARSDLPAPMLIADFDRPVQSMANGKWYTSKRDLAASHRASGNPHGIDFVELGNEKTTPKAPVYDEKKLRDDCRKAKADFDAGWRPDVVALED